MPCRILRSLPLLCLALLGTAACSSAAKSQAAAVVADADAGPTDASAAKDAPGAADAAPTADTLAPADAVPPADVVSDAPAPADVGAPADVLAPADVAALVDVGSADAAADGVSGEVTDAADDVAAADATAPATCIERAKLVYLLSSSDDLLAFYPDQLLIKPVGTLGCTGPDIGGPFSMAVDRNATAWVMYSGGMQGPSIFEVSTLDASCKPTAFQSLAEFSLFGMGFTANSPGATDETLYVAGSNDYFTGTNTLATIAFPGLAMKAGAQIDIDGGVELSGNGLGELYGFFPDSNPPAVRQIDTVTGAATKKAWKLNPNTFTGGGSWAFAQWGGTFYLFYEGSGDASTNVWKLDTASGEAKIVMPDIGYSIVGAGVSSCAPTKQ